MPIENYLGETFVAFVDISGFKVLMNNRDRAFAALNRFYQIGYNVLDSECNRTNQNRVDGIFISDCGILFSRLNGYTSEPDGGGPQNLDSVLSSDSDPNGRIRDEQET